MADMPQARPQVDPDTLLREQQKQEYERAREQDLIKQIEEQSRQEHLQREEQARQAKQKEEEARLAEIERKRQELEQARLDKLKLIQLPDEPEAGPDVAEIVFRAPCGSGKKISRRFLKTDSTKVLFDYVRTLDATEIGFDDRNAAFQLF